MCKYLRVLITVVLCSTQIVGCGGGDGTSPSVPPPHGGSVSIVVDTGQILGTVTTVGGSNHSGLSAFAPQDGLSLVPDLKSIPYKLNRIHFFGTTPTGDNFNMLPQSSPTSWDFSHIDKVVKIATELRKNGGPDFVMCISYCPTWMTTNNQPTTAPANNDVFAKYCERLVRYYNAGSFVDDNGNTISNPSGVVGIKYWEIWNEPDDTLYVAGSPAAFTPSQYATMFITASAQMRSADSTILIGGPNTAWQHQTYIDALFAAGAQLDLISIHHYPGEATETDQVILTKAATAVSVSTPVSKPLIIGEINALSDWNDPRMKSSFDLAFQPLAYKSQIEAGTANLIRWETVEDSFPLMNLDGTRHRNYWMERYFWSSIPPDSSRISCSSSLSNVVCLGVLEAGKLRLVIINKGVANSADKDGSGVKYDITVSVPTGNYEIIVVDRNTNPLNGPAVTVQSGNTVTLTIDGYGMAVVRQQ